MILHFHFCIFISVFLDLCLILQIVEKVCKIYQILSFLNLIILSLQDATFKIRNQVLILFDISNINGSSKLQTKLGIFYSPKI